MKRVAAFVLLFAFLFYATELHQLLRFPALVSHFVEHQHARPDLTFWQFITIHYFDKKVVDEDYSKDLKLPFKDCSCNLGVVLLFVMQHNHPLENFNNNSVEPATELKEQSEYYRTFISSMYSSSIWQPPKFI
ncbi:MAG: hypothetical protein KBA06_03405 [Saprospiraceae bacterium]|nr:hypothetical protein [Saprospiraceae bacterium]